MKDIKKSLNEILYERTTSPLFGTLIISWTIWNWKIIYLTIFVSESSIPTNKIDYIQTNYTDDKVIFLYPIISTVVLLTIIPFISNGAYWLSLKFLKWRKDQKNLVDMKQLLSLEQSIELREKISEQEARFEKLLENKNLEIKQLNLIMNSLKEQPANISSKEKDIWISERELEGLANRLKNSESELKEYNEMLHRIQGSYKLAGYVNSNTISLMESFNIIRNKGNGAYEVTEIGKQFHRLLQK